MTNEQKYKTAEERIEAFAVFCDRNECLKKCAALGNRDPSNITTCDCMAHWLSLEAEDERLEPCFYCGGKVHLDDNGPMLFYIQCNCGYRSRDFTRRDIAIAEHNRVARAVREAKKGESK